MPLMKYYIGLDAHSTTSTFAVVDENGQCVLRETVKTSEQSLVHVINKIHGVRHMTFEESSISQWLYIHLKDKVDKLIICNPTYIAKKQGAKTDFRDALHLAQELRTNHLQAVFHDTSHWMEIRTTVSGYLDIVEEIVRFKNRLKSVFRAEAIPTNENSFYINKDRVKEIKNPSAKFVAEKLFTQVEFLENEKDKYKEVFEKNRKKYRPIRNLMTIPGISIIRANIIAAIVCQPARFENKHKFWGYCMLVRHIQISNGKIYGNKRFFGRRELRNVFIGAAENALRVDGELRDRYEALRAKGVDHKDAKLNLARQIASISLCLLKNNDKYNENYGEYLKERKKTRQEFFDQNL
jgi:transposase